MCNVTRRLDRLERRACGIGLQRFRPIIVVSSPDDVEEVKAAKAADVRVYILCNPQHRYLLGGSIIGRVLGGIDLATDI